MAKAGNKVVGRIAPTGGARVTRTRDGLTVDISGRDLAKAVTREQGPDMVVPADDRDWSWMPARAAEAAPAAEHALWTLTKKGHRVEARTRATPLGPELRLYLDAELMWSKVIRPATEDAMAAAADQKRLDFEAKGWTVPA